MKNRIPPLTRLGALIAGIRDKLAPVCLSGLMLCLAHTASAQDYRWSGLGNDGLWANPNNWNPVGVPPDESGLNPTNGGNVILDPANGWSVITITNGEVENPGVGGSNPPFNTIFGPEFGCSLNIHGTLNYDWVLVPVQSDPTPSARTKLNMYGNSTLSTSGAGLALADEWFYWGGPYITMNMYDNSQVNINGGAGLWLGGHLSMYDSSRLTVQGYVNMETRNALSDGTRSLVIGGGTLVLPTGWTNLGAPGQNSGTPYDWIARGILRAYGKAYDTNDTAIHDDGTNTFVTTVPLGGTLQRIYFQPLVRPAMTPGMFQQSTLVGDYPSVSGVLLSSSEPGINPVLIGTPIYTSSNPNVVTVDTNGMVTAVGLGTATISATIGVHTSTNTLSVTVNPMTSTLVHRYSFSESSGATTTADSVGGPSWDGAVNGNATFSGGQMTLDGVNAYVLLPGGLISNLDELTIETWGTFGSPVNTWACLYAFGDAGAANGRNYVTLQPHTGAAATQAGLGQGDPGSGAERDAVVPTPLDNQTNVHIVAVYRPTAGSLTIYTNGLQAARVSIFNNLIDPIAVAGSTYTNGSILPFTLGADPINFIGRSLYSADPYLNATLDEFRIYSGALSAGQINADHALGPNQLIGSNTNVSLNAAISGGNVLVSWPTNSALVNLMSSPTVGPGAVWTPVGAQFSLSGASYEAIVPASGSARFFRLQQ